ncbi:MAG: hypothetical protein ACREJ0_30265 [Geminicoccaceae bacterium]
MSRKRRRTRKHAAWVALAAGLCSAPSAAPLAAEQLVSDQWQYQLTPYLWFLSLDGDVTVKGVKTSPSVDFSEIFDNLDIGVMVEGEIRKGRIGIYANVIYAELSSTDDIGPIEIKADATTVWAGAGAYYRLGPWALDPEKGLAGPKVVVDPYAGARFTYLDTKLKIRHGGPQVDANQSWVDPIIGVRTLWPLTEKLSVTAFGDIGGFGAGSDFTWQAAGLVGYRFGLLGDDNAKVLAGYRALYQDYKSGSGRNEFKWDMTLHGPVLGLVIGF